MLHRRHRQNHTQKRASPYSKTQTCPERMFLSEAIARSDTTDGTTNAQHHDESQRLLRIMGLVVTTPSLSQNRQPEVTSDRTTRTNAPRCRWTFLLDDGTALIDVVLVGEGEEGNADDERPVPETERSNEGVGSPPRPEFAEGDCVDCVGAIECVRLPQGDERSDGTIVTADGDGGRSTPPRNDGGGAGVTVGDATGLMADGGFEAVSCFLVRTVSSVSDPNMFALRMAELTYVAGHDRRSTSLPGARFDDGDGMDGGEGTAANETGIYMYGGLLSRDPNKERSRILYLVQLSRPDGLSESELAVLLGYETAQECDSLRYWLGDMHANFEIYQNKERSYLPL